VNESEPIRPQSHSNRKLSASHFSPREQETRDIAAADQEDKRNCPEEHPESGPKLRTRYLPLERNYGDPLSTIGIRILFRETLSNDVHFALCLLQTYAWLKPRNRSKTV
jgi:hypothetical protein